MSGQGERESVEMPRGGDDEVGVDVAYDEAAECIVLRYDRSVMCLNMEVESARAFARDILAKCEQADQRTKDVDKALGDASPETAT